MGRVTGMNMEVGMVTGMNVEVGMVTGMNVGIGPWICLDLDQDPVKKSDMH